MMSPLATLLFCASLLLSSAACAPTVSFESLESRARADQKIRQQLSKSMGKDSVLTAEMSHHDSLNTIFLRSLLNGRAWFDQYELSRSQEIAAFTLLQHSVDYDIQEKAVEPLRARADSGVISKRDLAALEDRVLIFKDLPQIYGTQMKEVDGMIVAYPVDDPVMTDERRKAIGLPPLKDLLEMANKFYQKQQSR